MTRASAIALFCFALASASALADPSYVTIFRGRNSNFVPYAG